MEKHQNAKLLCLGPEGMKLRIGQLLAVDAPTGGVASPAGNEGSAASMTQQPTNAMSAMGPTISSKSSRCVRIVSSQVLSHGVAWSHHAVVRCWERGSVARLRCTTHAGAPRRRAE